VRNHRHESTFLIQRPAAPIATALWKRPKRIWFVISVFQDITRIVGVITVLVQVVDNRASYSWRDSGMSRRELVLVLTFFLSMGLEFLGVVVASAPAIIALYFLAIACLVLMLFDSINKSNTQLIVGPRGLGISRPTALMSGQRKRMVDWKECEKVYLKETASEQQVQIYNGIYNKVKGRRLLNRSSPESP
jgi:hypothetical protein